MFYVARPLLNSTGGFPVFAFTLPFIDPPNLCVGPGALQRLVRRKNPGRRAFCMAFSKASALCIQTFSSNRRHDLVYVFWHSRSSGVLGRSRFCLESAGGRDGWGGHEPPPVTLSAIRSPCPTASRSSHTHLAPPTATPAGHPVRRFHVLPPRPLPVTLSAPAGGDRAADSGQPAKAPRALRAGQATRAPAREGHHPPLDS